MSHVIFMMLVLRIWYQINKKSTSWGFSYLFVSLHLSPWYCIDIVRRNTVLVTHRSKEGNVFSTLIAISKILLLCDIIIFRVIYKWFFYS